jgi:hypothetical protein
MRSTDPKAGYERVYTVTDYYDMTCEIEARIRALGQEHVVDVI